MRRRAELFFPSPAPSRAPAHCAYCRRLLPETGTSCDGCGAPMLAHTPRTPALSFAEALRRYRLLDHHA